MSFHCQIPSPPLSLDRGYIHREIEYKLKKLKEAQEEEARKK
jgi:hypothetical protein